MRYCLHFARESDDISVDGTNRVFVGASSHGRAVEVRGRLTKAIGPWMCGVQMNNRWDRGKQLERSGIACWRYHRFCVSMSREVTLVSPPWRTCLDGREATVEKEATCGICADNGLRVVQLHLRYVSVSGASSQRTNQPGASVPAATAEEDRGGKGWFEGPFSRGDRSIGYA